MDKGIVFIFQINDLSGIKMCDEDIVVILSNLLNNAIEACEKCSGKKFMKMKLVKEKDNIIISVKNTYDGKLNIKDGEIVILYGPSGSGKSTFMKILTERIRDEKSPDIPSTSRFLINDDKLKNGSLNIFDELFCCSENPDLVKMQEILENLHLWSEIKANCFEVWKWMKQKQFDQSLSNGQKQRMILAKMLYWLDAKIDVLVLDECTSGLDDKSETDSADAERILEYIVRFANSDKKRIVIISTHQNIDGFKKNLENEYSFRNLKFAKEGKMNLVREI